MSDQDKYENALAAAGAPLLECLTGFEAVMRRLHPPELDALRDLMRPRRDALAVGLEVLAGEQPPEPLAAFHERFRAGAVRLRDSLDLFLADEPAGQPIMAVLAAMQKYTEALELLYVLHRFPPIGRFFVEDPLRDRLEELDVDQPEGVTVGLHRTGGDDPAERGGFCLYIPESYDKTGELPLVIALHGGSGNGRGFLWSWLREARSRRFALLAPTSRGPTWSLAGPDIDIDAIRAMIELVCERWRIDRERILLTGLSDGATYTLLAGLREATPFAALAPLSGVLHPAAESGDALEQAAGRRIYLVHGAQDWMFPVQTARRAAEVLEKAGAQIVYREIPDLSHTYAREENARILEWFDPTLALS